MTDALLSMVCSEAVALSRTPGEPVELAHKAISSIAAANACWLCSSRVRTSATAMLAGVSDMTVFLDGDANIVVQHAGDGV